MAIEKIRIATRKSALALWQAEHVAEGLRRAHPGLAVELVGMTTRGDKLLDAPLAKVGGKGLFIKELEFAMLEGRADIAVHSMKDVPAHLPDGFELAAVLEREDPRDALVSNAYEDLTQLPVGARVGTCSLRRQCQLAERFAGFELVDVRGNVNTRLAKLDAGEFDALILAAAGLIRLDMADRIARVLQPGICLPAVGQGAVGIECKVDDDEVAACVRALEDSDTKLRLRAERALNVGLQGSCQVPLAGFAELDGTADSGRLRLRGLIGLPDGSRVLRAEAVASVDDPEGLGYTVADDLLSQGADEILSWLETHF